MEVMNIGRSLAGRGGFIIEPSKTTPLLVVFTMKTILAIRAPTMFKFGHASAL
jgi:hypothetical protein